MGRPKSWAWKHFEEAEAKRRAICQHCSKQLVSIADRMVKHLTICESTPQAVKHRALNTLAALRRKGAFADSSSTLAADDEEEAEADRNNTKTSKKHSAKTSSEILAKSTSSTNRHKRRRDKKLIGRKRRKANEPNEEQMEVGPSSKEADSPTVTSEIKHVAVSSSETGLSFLSTWATNAGEHSSTGPHHAVGSSGGQEVDDDEHGRDGESHILLAEEQQQQQQNDQHSTLVHPFGNGSGVLDHHFSEMAMHHHHQNNNTHMVGVNGGESTGGGAATFDLPYGLLGLPHHLQHQQRSRQAQEFGREASGAMMSHAEQSLILPTAVVSGMHSAQTTLPPARTVTCVSTSYPLPTSDSASRDIMAAIDKQINTAQSLPNGLGRGESAGVEQGNHQRPSHHRQGNNTPYARIIQTSMTATSSTVPPSNTTAIRLSKAHSTAGAAGNGQHSSSGGGSATARKQHISRGQRRQLAAAARSGAEASSSSSQSAGLVMVEQLPERDTATQGLEGEDETVVEGPSGDVDEYEYESDDDRVEESNRYADQHLLTQGERESLRLMFAKCVFRSGLPLGSFDSQEWESFFSRLNPFFKLPTKKALAEVYLPQVYDTLARESNQGILNVFPFTGLDC